MKRIRPSIHQVAHAEHAVVAGVKTLYPEGINQLVVTAVQVPDNKIRPVKLEATVLKSIRKASETGEEARHCGPVVLAALLAFPAFSKQARIGPC